jgi:hypothetical protein
MINERNGTSVEMLIGRGNRSIQRKIVTVPHYSLQIPHELTSGDCEEPSADVTNKLTNFMKQCLH